MSRIVILENATLGAGAAASFDSESAAALHLLARTAALVKPALRQRYERALADRIVSEDGQSAVSEVLKGPFVFARALAKAYAPGLAVVVKRIEEEPEDV